MESITNLLLLKKKISFLFLTFVLSFAFTEQFRIPTNIREVSVYCESETVFTQTDIPFTFELADVELSDVQADLGELPMGVRLISSKRSTALDSEGKNVARIEFWFNFSDVGQITIPPLTVQIDSKIYYVPFETVTVYENPAIVSPILSIKINNQKSTYKIGEKIRFSVYIQYCVQILNYSFKLPKDSLFTELSREEITKSDERRTEFTPQKFKLAEYEWQPLVKGEYKLPNIQVDTIAYNGDRKHLSLPESLNLIIKVTDSNIQENDSKLDSSVFSEAFLPSKEIVENKRDFSQSDLLNLAELRSAERHSFPFSQKMKEREQIELEFGIKESDSEPSVYLFTFLTLLFILSFIIFILTIIFKHPRTSVLFVIFIGLFGILSVTQYLKISSEYGISKGGIISAVPELIFDTSSKPRTIPAGQRVKIVEHIGDWIYIECSETSGWTKAENVLIIK